MPLPCSVQNDWAIKTDVMDEWDFMRFEFKMRFGRLSILHKAYGMIRHYNDVVMSAIASHITNLTIVFSIVYSDADQRKHQSTASLAFVRGIHRGPVNSPHKWPVTRKMFPFDDVIMNFLFWSNKTFCKLTPFPAIMSQLQLCFGNSCSVCCGWYITYMYHQPLIYAAPNPKT